MTLTKRILNILTIGLVAGLVETQAIKFLSEKEIPREQKILRPGRIYETEFARKFVGVPRGFREGIEQKIFIDYTPFGSLDRIQTRQWSSDRSYLGTLKARAPLAGEEDAFFLLHYSNYENPRQDKSDMINPD